MGVPESAIKDLGQIRSYDREFERVRPVMLRLGQAVGERDDGEESDRIGRRESGKARNAKDRRTTQLGYYCL